jgi:hypothetical protein
MTQSSSDRPAPLLVIQDANAEAGLSGSHIVNRTDGESRDVIDSGLATLATVEILLEL